MKNLTSHEETRFRSKFTVRGACWVWNGPLDRDGYGSFHLRGAPRRAHRVAWFSVHGEIPDGMVVNHTCRNRACVNPQHLNCITAIENAKRDSASIPYINSQKSTCPQGHPYDKTVTWGGKTQRICTVCARERSARNKRRQYQAAKNSLRV